MATIIAFVDILVTILTIAIVIRAITTWFPVDPYNKFIIILYQLTDPILDPIRKLIPPIGGTLDITPIIAIVGLHIIRALIASLA
jgi:YggT family protein